MPIATGGHAPHWSRWEKSATTFGPVGRIGWTVAFVASVLVAGSNGMIIYVLMAPVVGWVLLPAIWAKGWIIPDEPDTPPLPETPRPEVATPPPTKAMVAWRIAWWAAASAALLTSVYGPVEAKAVVLSGATLAGLYAFWRGYLTR
jgi:hypothetical protein